MRVSVSGPAAAVVPTAGREPPTPGAEGRGTVAAASVPDSVQLALSVLHALLYAELFAFAYLQLWRLLLYRQRRLSYQSLCLFLCPVWAVLRTKLFWAAFSLSGSLPLLQPPARLHFFPHWLLYCFPSCLQFSTLCLLNLYLAENSTAFRIHTGKPSVFSGELDLYNAGPWRCPRKNNLLLACIAWDVHDRWYWYKFMCTRILLHFGFILASLLFLVVNLTCAMLVHGDVPESQLKWTVFIHALINDSLFILLCYLLS